MKFVFKKQPKIRQKKISPKKKIRDTKMFKISSPATFILLHFSKSWMVWPQKAKNRTTKLKLLKLIFNN
jgi:hypothetical protein